MIDDYPPGLDAAAVLAGRADESEFWQLWRLHAERSLYQRAIERDGPERGIDTTNLAARLAELPAISALQALQANRRLVDLLTGRRWMVMEEAREAGATWAEIGEELGTTRQGAQDWYRRKIEAQEQHAPDFHDATRARAALHEDEIDHRTTAPTSARQDDTSARQEDEP